MKIEAFDLRVLFEFNKGSQIYILNGFFKIKFSVFLVNNREAISRLLLISLPFFMIQTV